MGLSRTWCRSGEFVLECENIQVNRLTFFGDLFVQVNLSGR